jgi:hypothetical protein
VVLDEAMHVDLPLLTSDFTDEKLVDLTPLVIVVWLLILCLLDLKFF